MYLNIVIKIIGVQYVIQPDFCHNPAFLYLDEMLLALPGQREEMAHGPGHSLMGHRLYQVVQGLYLIAFQRVVRAEGGENHHAPLVLPADPAGGPDARELSLTRIFLAALKKDVKKYQIKKTGLPHPEETAGIRKNRRLLAEGSIRTVGSYILGKTAGVFLTIFNNRYIQGNPFVLKNKRGPQSGLSFQYIYSIVYKFSKIKEIWNKL